MRAASIAQPNNSTDKMHLIEGLILIHFPNKATTTIILSRSLTSDITSRRISFCISITWRKINTEIK